MRKRRIQKYGNTFIIKLYPVDMEDFEIKEGDFVDIDDIVVLKGKKKTINKK